MGFVGNTKLEIGFVANTKNCFSDLLKKQTKILMDFVANIKNFY